MVRQWNALTEPSCSHYLTPPLDGRCALFALFFRAFDSEGSDRDFRLHFTNCARSTSYAWITIESWCLVFLPLHNEISRSSSIKTSAVTPSAQAYFNRIESEDSRTPRSYVERSFRVSFADTASAPRQSFLGKAEDSEGVMNHHCDLVNSNKLLRLQPRRFFRGLYESIWSYTKCRCFYLNSRHNTVTRNCDKFYLTFRSTIRNRAFNFHFDRFTCGNCLEPRSSWW